MGADLSLLLGVPVHADITGAPNRFPPGGCFGPAGEHVYTVDVPPHVWHRVTLTVPFDAVLAVRCGALGYVCNPDLVPGPEHNVMTFSVDRSAVCQIVVEGSPNPSGVYDLVVTRVALAADAPSSTSCDGEPAQCMQVSLVRRTP